MGNGGGLKQCVLGWGSAVDIHDLEVFKAAYEKHSLTGAAQSCFISRQALSKTILRLESELGRLFVRKARGVVPTVLADAAYPHVCRALDELDEVSAISVRFASGQAGSIRLAVEANAALTLPAGLIGAYAQARPNVRVESDILPPRAARESLQKGAADAVVAGPFCASSAACSSCSGGCGQSPQAGLCYEPIFASRLVIVFSYAAFDDAELVGLGERGTCLCSRSQAMHLHLEALAGKTIFGIDPANSVERTLAPYLESHVPTATLAYGNPDTALTTSMMRSGHGGVIVEEHGAELDFGTPAYIHIPLEGDDAPMWKVGVSFAEKSPVAPIARDFANFARAECVGERAAS